MDDKPSVPRSTAIAIGIASILLMTSLLLLQRLGVISDLNIRETDELTELRRRVDDVLQTDNRGLGKLNAACVFQAPLDKSIEELDAAYQQLLRQLNAKYHLNLASDSFNLSQDALHSDGKLACLTSEQVIVRITRIQAQLSNTKNTPPLPPKRRHSTDKSAG